MWDSEEASTPVYFNLAMTPMTLVVHPSLPGQPCNPIVRSFLLGCLLSYGYNDLFVAAPPLDIQYREFSFPTLPPFNSDKLFNYVSHLEPFYTKYL